MAPEENLAKELEDFSMAYEARENFLLDFENSCLKEWGKPNHPTGIYRWLDEEWGEFMRNACANHSDVTFEQYFLWCVLGGGDEWFQDEFHESIIDERISRIGKQVNELSPFIQSIFTSQRRRVLELAKRGMEEAR